MPVGAAPWIAAMLSLGAPSPGPALGAPSPGQAHGAPSPGQAHGASSPGPSLGAPSPGQAHGASSPGQARGAASRGQGRGAASPGPGVGAPSPGPVALEWEAPAGCPDGESVVLAAERLLGEVASANPGPSTGTPVRARGRIVADRGQWILTLTLEAGERVIRSERCEPLAETAALLLAIAVDPRVLGDGEAERTEGPGGPLEPAPTEPTTPVEPPQPQTQPQPPQPQPQPMEAQDRPGPDEGIELEGDPPPRPEGEAEYGLPTGERPSGWAMAVRAIGGIGVGVLPRYAATAGLAVAFERDLLRLEALGTFWGPADVTSPTNATVGGRFLLGTAGARLCLITPPRPPRARPIRARVLVCTGAEVGGIRGKGEGAIRANVVTSPFFGLLMAAALRLDVGRDGALVLDAALVGVPLRPRFHTEPSGALWETGPVGGRFGVGIELGGLLQKALAGGQRRSRR
ncbi:MAG: hypothetical protein R3B09_27790 [Nannocystaceae bacterium]